MLARITKYAYGLPVGTVFEVVMMGYRTQAKRTLLLAGAGTGKARADLPDLVVQYEHPHIRLPIVAGGYKGTWLRLGEHAELINSSIIDNESMSFLLKEG